MTRRGYVPVDEIDRLCSGQLVPLQPDKGERARISLLIRSRSGEHTIITELKKMEVLLPAERNYVSREQYAEQFGASDADVAAVEAFAQDNGLTVVRTSHSRRLVDLSGRRGAVHGRRRCGDVRDGSLRRQRAQRGGNSNQCCAAHFPREMSHVPLLLQGAAARPYMSGGSRSVSPPLCRLPTGAAEGKDRRIGGWHRQHVVLSSTRTGGFSHDDCGRDQARVRGPRRRARARGRGREDGHSLHPRTDPAQRR